MKKIAFIILLLISFCSFGQQKHLDYIKQTSFNRTVYGDSESPFYRSSTTISKDSNEFYFSKTMDFNSTAKVEYYHSIYNRGLIEFHSDWHDSAYFSIYHYVVDTINHVESKISFDTRNGDVISSNLEIEFYNSGLFKRYELSDAIIRYYENWVISDAEDDSSFHAPDFYDLSQLKGVTIRQGAGTTITQGDTTISTNYWIDSVYSNNHFQRDSIFLRQMKSFTRTDDHGVKTYTELIENNCRNIKDIYHDTILNRTEQHLCFIQDRDTIYDIHIATALDSGSFVSDYIIKGNHPLEYSSQRYGPYKPTAYFKLDTLQSRKIHVVRDSAGYITEGNASGVSSNGDILKSRIFVRQYFPSKFTPRNRFKGIGRKQIWVSLQEYQTPQKIYLKINGQTEARQFEIVSLYPNLDEKPLGKIVPINGDGMMYKPFVYKQKKRKFKSRKRRRKNNFKSQTTKYDWKRSKKLKSSEKNVKKWKVLDFDSYTIYEYHYSK